ncbi:MAG TPA: YdeI/OmpD-associated family protein [Candidatus Saccharimonadales bacterium]|nr:YdeI/OmpD-associated family protein [Candidatus Saccharimonadales bacterium]
MSPIHFQTKLFNIGSWTILKLPKDASAKLPSRGQTMVKGTINGFPFQTPLEPDGNWSHWFRVGKSMQKSIKAEAGDTVALAIESTRDWPEPNVPADFRAALNARPEVQALWMRITPMARHEWIRWIGSTSQSETRKRRIEAACSKLLAGERRPCCFNRNACCVTQVSKNGVLLEPTEARE